MPVCSTCKREVEDIRPQIDGVGVCFSCADRPMAAEALKLWKQLKSAYTEKGDDDGSKN